MNSYLSGIQPRVNTLPVLLSSGIEIDEDKLNEADSDFTIRGRLMSLVEKVVYLKKKMTFMPKNKKKDKKPSKPSLCRTQCLQTAFSR